LVILKTTKNLENDEAKYSKHGKKIIDFIISKYPTTIQGRVLLVLKAQIQADEGYKTEVLKLLQDNYEVVLSIEKYKAYPNYLYELNFENNDPIIAEYFFLLANTHYYLNEENEAIKIFNTLITSYPNSEATSNSKRVIKAINALNKSL
jgi:outer membrane protein assembly factor BamD (BamD/ComL family)